MSEEEALDVETAERAIDFIRRARDLSKSCGYVLLLCNDAGEDHLTIAPVGPNFEQAMKDLIAAIAARVKQ